jgi:hypothetical protein
MVDLVAGAFIAGEDVEARGLAEEGEGGEEFGRVADGLVPHAGFEREDAVLTPAGEDPAVHAGTFGGIAGLQSAEVFLEEGVEVLAGFVLEEGFGELAAAATVAEAVARRAELAYRGPGAG